MDKEKELGYMEIREQICDVCHKMWQLGWVAILCFSIHALCPDIQ